MQKKLSSLLVFSLVCITLSAQQFIAEGRKALALVPAQTAGVAKAVVSLNGTWEINMNPVADQWNKTEGNWKKVQVPGEPAMQGYPVTNDKEFFYRTTISIPSDAKNKTVLIRFNGVYSYARVFVNGNFVREHFGGFTAWDADISEYAKPGTNAIIHVGVTDRADDISYSSGYAHHPIGGILREVKMMILPHEYLNRFYIQTDLSDNFKQATLNLNVAKNKSANNSKLAFQLMDAKGKNILAQSFDLNKEGNGKFAANVMNPILWNEEKPYLYTLKASLITNGETTESIEQKIGFRNVVVDGKIVLVNGDPVKLRGACRHDMHPLYGRSTNRFYDSLDVALAKESNVNFIRTSHYPPSPDFLEFADRFGIYVQEETAICFVNNWRTGIYFKLGETNNDSSFTARYLGQLSEMIDRDRNHPCVIMWSIGNESNYGTNFQKSYEFLKSIDLSRPVSWTWPGTAYKENKRCFDIAVAHYPGYDGKDDENFGLRYKNMEHESLPLLSDEWAHVACYNLTLLRDDPNVKDFWGRSLDSMWANRFDVPGNLGGAIWGMTDETFNLPDTSTGYGPWGFIDIWRRKKVEFWNTKKAYSPVRVLKTQISPLAINGVVNVPIKNRFNHLSLDQIKLKITQNGKSFYQALPALKPHEEGNIALKGINPKSSVLLQFLDEKNNLIDEENISFSQSKPIPSVASSSQWKVEQIGNTLELNNNKLAISINAATGQLISARSNGDLLLTDGMRVIVNQAKDPHAFKESEMVVSGEYKVSKANINTGNKNKIVVTSNGFVSKYPVIMTTAYFSDGTIETAYEVDSIPTHSWQIGVAYPISNTVDAIQWQRNGYWSTYPANHLSANTSMAKRFTNVKEHYRVEPKYEVSQTMNDYYLTGTIVAENASMNGSEAYRATKENILSMDLMASGKSKIKLLSNGLQAAKINMHIPGKQELAVMDKWDYWTLSWGNFAGNKNNSTVMKGKTTIKLVQ